MNNLRKRILSLILSGVMTLSMAAPFTVLAEDVDLPVVSQEQGASSGTQDVNSVPGSTSHDDNTSILSEEKVEESPAQENPELESTARESDEVQDPAAEAAPSSDVVAHEAQAEEGAARIGDTYYATFPEAVAAASAGQTITVLQDVQLGEAVTINKNLTIVAKSGATVTISRAEGYTGALFVQTNGVLKIGESQSDNAGSLVLDGGATWLIDQVVTDDAGRAVLDEQGEEQMETVEAESPAVPDAYDAKAAVTAALITVTKGDLYVQETATLQNNHSSADGGAIATTAGGNAKIHLYGTMTGNATDGNGGVYSGNSYITVYDKARLNGNYAAGDGGAIYLYGGGVANSIKGEFTQNAADGNGGALWLDGKSLIEDGTFTENRAVKGGALYTAVTYDSRAIQIRGGTFTGNKAETGADAVLVPDDSSSNYGWTTVSGAVTFDDAYIGAGKYLAVSGALSGSVKFTVGGTLADGQEVARGSGYTLVQSDVEHLALHNAVYGLQFESGAAKLQKLPEITITTQPQAFENIGLNESAILTVETSLEGVTCQWYACADADGSSAQAIAEATSFSYSAPTDKVGHTYYYCILMAGGYAETKTNVVPVKVIDQSAAAPVIITTQPQGGEWGLGKAASLTVAAKADGAGESSELSYQWYGADSENGEFTKVENGTSETLALSTAEPSEGWYYCIVTNTEADKEPSTATAQTRTVHVKVLAAKAYFNGTAYATLDDAADALNASSAAEKTLVLTGDDTLSKTIAVSSGTLTISADADSAVTVTRAPDFKASAMLRVSGGELTIENVKFDGGAAWSGTVNTTLLRGTETKNNVSSPILNQTNGKVTLKNGSALQNNCNPSGAGAINMTSGTLTLEGGSLLDSYGGSHGGALYATGSGSTILIKEGEIKGNHANGSSGGLCVDSGAKLTIEGGTIRNNYTRGRAGGLFINGTFVMTGGQIINNRAEGSSGNGGGGGIVHNNGSFTLSGDARIEGNSTGTTGGGIASFGGKLTIEGGTITGNTAKNGGGIYKNTQQTSGSIEVTGGSITGNEGDCDVSVTKDVTLGATIDPQYMGTWSFGQSFTVSFNGNGAASPDSITLHFLEAFGDKLPAAPVRNGYAFLGWFTDAEGGEQVKAESLMSFRADTTLYAHWQDNATTAIILSDVSESGTYLIEETPVLSLTATGADNITYQWYQCDDAEGTNPRPVEEGTSDTLALPTNLQALGMYYYYCLVSGDGAVDVKTDIISVKLLSNSHAMVPQITKNPQDADLFVGDDVALSVEASVIDGGTITYQWYRADNAEDSGTPIDGATEPEYCFHSSQAEEGYYYALILNEIEGYQLGMTTSARAHIVVHNRITVSDVTASDTVMSTDYWQNHRVGTTPSDDGYITEVTSRHGNWAAISTVDKAFDGNWDTFWETSQAADDNCLEMTFSKPVTLDRILYATRRTQQGKGYPTRLTVYGIPEGESDYRELGVAVSSLRIGYVLFTLPESVTLTALRFEFNESQYVDLPNWASAAELVLLRDEATVLAGKAEISGIAASGAALTVTATSGENQTVENWAYQWQSSADGKAFADIAGATDAVYTVREEDKDLYLRAVVRDADGQYSGSLLSDVYRGVFGVSVEGDTSVGGLAQTVLQYASGEGLTLRYQWQVGDSADGSFSDIPGEYQPTLVIPTLATNKFIRVQVTAEPSEGMTTTVASEPVRIGVTALMYGPPAVDVTLRAGLLGSTDEAFTCQWQRGDTETGDFTNIDGATESSYTLTADDLNKYIRVQITTGGETLSSEAWLVYPKDTFPQDLVNFKGNVLYISDLDDSYCFITNGGDGLPLRKDKNYAGGNLALLVNGQIKYYLKGFGGLSTSSFVYSVQNYVKYYHLNRFIARVGVDAVQDYDGNTDGVIFTTSAATREPGSTLQWNTLNKTEVLRKTSESVGIDVMLPENLVHVRITTALSGKSKYVYTDMADVKLVTADYQEAASDQQVFLPVEEYDLRIQELVASHKDMSYEQMLNEDQELRKLVYQRALVNDAGYSLLEALMPNEDTAKTLEWLFNDQKALEMFVGGGLPDGAYGRAFKALANLYTQRGDDLAAANPNSDLYLRMMMALALTHSNDVTFWVDISQVSNSENVVDRYDIYKRMHANGLLVKAFDTLNVEEMRMVMNNIIDNNEIEWLNWYNRKRNYGTVDPSKVNITVNNINANPYTYVNYTFDYNYSRSQYFAADRKAEWQEKYGLTFSAMQPQDQLDIYKNIDVLYQSGHPKLWAVFEEGAVCGGISKTGTNLMGAYGIPGGVVGQPGHAAYLRYAYTDEANGIARYDIYNDIFGWPKSARAERMPCGWGSQSWAYSDRVSYINMAQDALNDEDNYFTAQRLNLLADSFNNEASYGTQAAIYEAALSVQSYHFDTWVDMVRMYENQDKTSADYLALAGRISSALAYYPLPMYDTLEKLIKPHLNGSAEISSLTAYESAALRTALKATTANTSNPGACTQVANFLMGNHDFAVATFSFDGDKAGKIVLSNAYVAGGNEMLYSLDGGNYWINAGTVTEVELSPKDLESITAENDILVRLQGTTNYYTIDITKPSTSPKVNVNNNEQRLVSTSAALEWKTADSTDWKPFSAQERFAEGTKVTVRGSAHGTQLPGPENTYTIGKSSSSEERQYIYLENVELAAYSSAEDGKDGAAAHCIDGNIDTIWHTLWSGSDTERYVTLKLKDGAHYINALEYMPSQGASSNGRILKCEVYTSMTGDDGDWHLAATANWANNPNKKQISFTPAYAQYVKIVAVQGVNNFAAASMFELFEDTTVGNSTVTAIELASAPTKKEYVVGEELDLTGMVVTATFENGDGDTTSGPLNLSRLQFSPTILTTAGEQTITAKIPNTELSVSFVVTVSDNDKQPTKLTITQMPDKTRYFSGESLDVKGTIITAEYADGMTARVFDSSSGLDLGITWGEEILTAGDKAGLQTITVAYMNMTTTFEVEVSPKVASITVTKSPDHAFYSLGDVFDPTGMEVSAVYENGERDPLNVADYTISSENFSNTAGTKTLTVTYNRTEGLTENGKADTAFTVTVYPYITANGLQYEALDDTYECMVTGFEPGYVPQDGIVTIPETVETAGLTFTVVGIGVSSADGTGAFSAREDVKRVILPATITSIQDGAFADCKAFQSINLTAFENDFSNLVVSGDAFNSEDLKLSGIIYVKDAEVKKALEDAISAEDSKLSGFKNFTVVSVLDAVQTFTLVEAPAKKQYALGETLDTTGMELMVKLDDGTEFPIPENICEVTGFDPMLAGEQTLTVKLLTNNTYPEGTEFTVQFTVTVTPATPIFHMQPVGAAYALSELDSVKPLTAVAEINDAGTLTWQWYFSKDASGEGASPIEGANTAEVMPTPEMSGYYFAVATNTDGYGNAETSVSVQTDIVQVVFGDYEARVGTTYYDTLEQALNAAQNNETVTLIRDVTLGKNIALNKTITLTGHTILRDASYTDVLFTVKGGTLTLTDITIDGGAEWSETSQDSVLGRGTVNNGVSARQPILLVSGGEAVVGNGATLQNNSNNSNNYGMSGGAARVTGGKLRIAGGMIRNNYCIPYGGAVLSMGGEIILDSGAVVGNHGTSSGGVFCVDGSSAFTMTGGTIAGNRGGGNGGVIWLSNGKATIEGGSITGNASGTGTIFLNGSGTADVGAVTISGNTAGSVPGIHVNNGTLNFTAAPTLTDGVYLPNGKVINILCSLTGAQPIPVTVQSVGNDGTVIAKTQSEAQAKAAAKVLTMSNRGVYANGTNVCYQKLASFTVVKELPLTSTAVASKSLELTYQAKPDIGTAQYAWYRCEDASGANPALMPGQTGSTFSMNDCTEGTYYFYCVATSSDVAGSIRSQVCTVTVTPFVPASVAIEKFKALG